MDALHRRASRVLPRASQRRAKHREERSRALGRAAASVAAGLEPLEPRTLLANTPFISEFMASNSNGLRDEDGAASDWIEIQNPTTSPVNLDGYYLTDSRGDLTRWRIPAVTLPSSGYLVIFASDKDRAIAGQELHTDFNLEANGEYLALVAPDGATILSEYDYPEQVTDISYGIAAQINSSPIIGNGALVKTHIPANGSLGTDWTQVGFGDSAWRQGATGVGYDTVPTPPPYEGFTVRMVDTSSGSFENIGMATTVLDGNTAGFTVASNNSVNWPVVDFDGNGFGEDQTLPNGATTGLFNEDPKREQYVVRATANVFIPAGTYTMAVGSDDGFRLKIAGVTFTNRNNENHQGITAPSPSDTLIFSAPRGHQWTTGTFTLASGINTTITLDFYERGGGDSVELAFTPSAQTGFNGSFQLLRDNAHGWQLTSPPLVLPPDYRPHIGTNVQAEMLNVNTSAYLRLPFNVLDPAAYDTLRLRVRYDDGFVAYLNGALIGSRNAPSNPLWNSGATQSRADTDALAFQDLDIPVTPGLLLPGPNVLAIHGLNDAVNSDDFLIYPVLNGLVTLASAEQYFTNDTPGAANDPSSSTGVVADTTFDVDRGFYNSPFFLSIHTPTQGAQIRYTLDGSAPTATTGLIYTGPVHINKTTVVRAAAFKPGFISSDIDTQTYIFLDDVVQQSANGAAPAGWPTAWGGNAVDYGMDPDIVNHPEYAATIRDDLKAIPTINLTMDLNDLFGPSGIYSNATGDGRAWERPGSLELIYPDGSDGFQVNAGVRIRGGFSRQGANPKHAFRFFMRSEYGDNNLDFPLFGPDGLGRYEVFDLRTFQNYSWSFGGDSRGIFLRDQLNRDMQIAMGHQGERGDYYHLYINGQYWGLFNSAERPEAETAAGYFGGEAEDYDVVKSDPDIGYNVEATDGDLLAWNDLWNAVNTIRAITDGSGTAFDEYMALQGLDPDGSRNPNIPALLDVDNLIDYMLVIFYGGNLDAPISAFLSNEGVNNFFALRPRDGRFGFRFYVHDAEHTLLNRDEDRTGPFPAGSTFQRSNPQWFFQQLWSVPEFKLRVADHIRKHMFNGGVLTVEGATALFNARKAEIDRAVVGESARWGDSKRSTPFTRNDWLAAINTVLTQFIPQRTGILFTQLSDKGLYPTIAAPNFNQYGGQVNSGFQLTMSSPSGGTIYYRLDGLDPRLPGGDLRPGTLTYTAGITLNASTTVTARVQVGEDWSALTESDFRFNLSALKAAEVMYNPGPAAADQEFEFIELINTGATSMQLQGIHFTNGIDFTFPSRTLAAGGRVLLVKNLTQFRARYGNGLDSLIAGQYTGALDNGGETLTLVGPLDEPIFSFEYSDEWFDHTDGGGYSLVNRNPSASTSAILSTEDGWRPSNLANSAPGASDPGINPGTVVFSEAMANYTGPGGDWIELFNPTSQPVNIGGWFLSDSATDLRKYRIPDGTSIPAGGFLVFNEVSHFGRAGNAGVNTPFDLSDFRAEIHLTSNNGAEVAGFREFADFAASPPDTSFGRIVKSGGGTDFTQLTEPTLGTANAPAVVGPVVIHEVMYNPLGGHEFIELHNLTSQPVKLFLDDANPSVTWRFSDGLDYAFPAGATIPASGYALVVPIDASTFRATYGIPASVPIYGNYSPDGTGALSNGGADLKLMRPLSATIPPGQTTIPYALVDKVKYNDGGNWPASADGTGPSLSRINAVIYGNDSVNWKAGPIGGTPGRANVVSPPSAPTTLQVSGNVFTNRLTLRWTDTANDEERFRIERSTDGLNFTPIGTTSPNVLTFNSVGLSPSTTYYYRVRAENGAGISAYSNILAVTTANPPPASNGSGLFGEYFDGTNFETFIGSRLDARVNYSDGGGAQPFPNLEPTTFSARWTGRVQAQFDETYTFYTNSDDGVRLWVNNQLIIDNWTDHGPTENSGTVNLSAGQKYDVRLEFYENGGGAIIQLSWSSPSTPKSLIPTSQLFPPPSPAPAPPTNPAAAGTSSSSIRVRWADASATEQGFKVEISPNGASNWTLAGTAPVNATSFVVGNLNPNTTYHFRIRATNETGDSAATSVVSAQTAPTGVASPAGHWMLNESTGTNAADSSGNNFTGLLTGVTWSNEPQTGSFSANFPNTGTQQIRVADGATANPLLNPSAAITLAAWIKPTDWNGNRRIIQKGASDNQYRLTAENGLLKFHIFGVGDVTAALPAPGAWHHVAATYDGGALRLYVNGNLVGSRAATGDIVVAVSSLYIGAKSNATSADRFVGLIDDARLYGRALTESDIRTLVSINGAPAAAPTGLAATAQRNLQVRLTWNDTNRNEYGYRVERKTGAAGSWVDIGFAPGVAASAGSPQIAFVDASGLQNGQTYFYRVRAANTAGNGPASNEASATATFTTLPAPWQSGDVGSVGQPGSGDFASAGSIYTVRGSGADVFGTADGFHYVYQPLASGGVITARVASIDNTDAHAKAGVMIRQSLAPNSAYAFVGVKPSGALFFERRLSSGAGSVSETPITASAPYWVRLVRNGNTITAFTSANGSSWSQFGSPITITLTEPVLVGLAVTAHNNSLLNTSTFDNVSLTQAMNLAGTAGDDTFHVNLDAAGANVQIWQNRNPNVESPNFVLPRSAFTAFSINAGGGNDTLNIDFANGNPIPATGLTFDGAAGNDVLTVTGGSGAEAITINGSQVTFAGGAITVANAESVTLDGGAGNDTFTVNASMPINPLIVGGAGTNSLSIAAGTFTMIGSPAATSEAMDLTVASGARINFAASQTLRNLTLSGNAVAALTSGGAKALRLTGTLSIAPGAKLDLADNDLVLQSTPANRLAALTLLQDLVRTGRAGGAWTGNGITSSLAAASAMRNVGLAVLLNDKGDNTPVRDTFGGEPADTSSIIVKYTWNGDADINGLVDADDFMLADRGFLSTPVNGGWHRGDFNFDGKTNIDDFFLIDLASRTQSGPLAGAGVAPAPLAPPPPQGLLAPQSTDDSLFPDQDDTDDELQPLW